MLFGTDNPDDEFIRQALKTAGLTGPHDGYQVLVHAGRWDRDENLALRRADQPVAFVLKHRLEVHHKQGLVLDDQDVEVGPGRAHLAAHGEVDDRARSGVSRQPQRLAADLL